MSLEAATYISELQSANPPGTDKVLQGDDHIRLIKAVLQNTFPNLNGAVNTTPAELNVLDGADTGGFAASLLAAASASAARTVLGLGTAAVENVGTTAGDVVQLDSNAKLPAVDGSQLTGINTVPTGGLLPYAGSTAPSGYLLCDGSAVSRTTYADLFAVVGTTYGAGDGSTTFNVPDLRGRIPVGMDNMGGTSANRVTDAQADTLGGAMGEETHLLTSAESGVPAHTHGYYEPNAPSNERSVSSQATVVSRTYTQTAANTAQDASQAHNNMQPSIFLNWVIKV